MAFAPDYATSGLFYVYYTDRTGQAGQRPRRRAAQGRPRAATPRCRATPFEVLRIPHPTDDEPQRRPAPVRARREPLARTGDGGGGNDPDGNAQNPASLLGKLLRITPRPGRPATTSRPATRSAGGGGAPEVWALGLRNPWRFSFDRGTGDLLIGDVGQAYAEEIDRAPAPGLGCGANYGWRVDGRPTWLRTAGRPRAGDAITRRCSSTRAPTGGARSPAATSSATRRSPRSAATSTATLRQRALARGPRRGDDDAATADTLGSVVSFGEDAVAASTSFDLRRRLPPDLGRGENGVAAAPATFTPPGCDPTAPPPGDGQPTVPAGRDPGAAGPGRRPAARQPRHRLGRGPPSASSPARPGASARRAAGGSSRARGATRRAGSRSPGASSRAAGRSS